MATHNKCYKWFDLTVAQSGDMPLDTAFYNSTLGYIVGVRGGYLFKFNASSGSLVSAKRFADQCFQYGCACYGPNTGKIYATGWHEPMYNGALGRRIYTITPATMAVDSSYDLTPIMPSSYTSADDGPRTIYCIDSGGVDNLIIANQENGGHQYTIMRVTPPLVGSPACNNSAGLTIGGWMELTWDTTPTVWVVNRGNRRVTQLALTMGWMSDTATLAIGYLNKISGVAYPGGANLYVSTNTQYLFPIPIDGSPAGAAIDLGSGATETPNPYRVRWNGVALGAGAMLYVPGYKSDAIHVYNIDTATVTVVQGFDCPVDVVFAGSKAFAVQHGIVPLKEITLP